MTTQTRQFNASELCSRKLWQLVKSETEPQVNDAQLQQVIEELTTRRHYLAELSRMGKLGGNSNNA